MLDKFVRTPPLNARDIERVEEYLKTPPPRVGITQVFFITSYLFFFAFFVCQFLTYTP